MKQLLFAVALLAVAKLDAQEQNVTALDPIVVTVNRYERPLSAVTSRVTILDGDELRRSGVRTLLQALESVAGATTVDNGSFGSVASVFMRGGESDYVLVLIDGVPANDPGGSYNFADLDMTNVERIEIVHGPASVVYGTDAISGVIHIITRRGSGPTERTIGVRAGNFGSWGIDGAISGGTDRAGYSFSVSNFSTNGIYTESQGIGFDNGYRNSVASGRFDIRPDSRTRASFSVRWADSKYRFPTDAGGNIVDGNSFTSLRATSLAFDLSRRLGERATVDLSFTSYDKEGRFDDSQDGAADTLGFFEFRSLDNVRRRAGDARVGYELSTSTRLLTGVAIEEQRITSFSESRSQFGPSNGSSDAARTTRSAYTQLLGDPLENVSFSSGLRVDDSDRFGTFVTYRIGAALRLATGTRFRATVATGFKEPTFFENFATGFAVGNPDLDPERSASFEAGVEQSLWSGVARVDVAAFHQTFKDLVQFTFAPPNPGDPNYFNVAEARSRGIEMGLNIRPSTSFRAVLDLSYTDTEVIDAGFDAGDPDAAFAQGERLLRRPEFAGALAFEYTVGVVTVGERTSFVGDRIDRDFSTFPARRVTLDAYQLLDVYARVALTKPLPGSVLLRLDNALDKDYEQVLGFPARGRTLTVGVETRF